MATTPNTGTITPLPSLDEIPDAGIFPSAAKVVAEKGSLPLSKSPKGESKEPLLQDLKREMGKQRMYSTNIDIFMYLNIYMKRYINKHNEKVDRGGEERKTSIREFINQAIEEKLQRIEDGLE